jgi:hypothetical protein
VAVQLPLSDICARLEGVQPGRSKASSYSVIGVARHVMIKESRACRFLIGQNRKRNYVEIIGAVGLKSDSPALILNRKLFKSIVRGLLTLMGVEFTNSIVRSDVQGNLSGYGQ